MVNTTEISSLDSRKNGLGKLWSHSAVCLAPKSLFKIILMGYIEGLNEGAVPTQDWQTQCETKIAKTKQNKTKKSYHRIEP